jgi:hypothetical protein
MTFAHPIPISFAPGFGLVGGAQSFLNRLSGFAPPEKPLKRLNDSATRYTGLKPGANESAVAQSAIVNRKS